MPPLIAIGECMLELVRDGERWRLGHAGDTFNTALYLCRLGVPVAYLTALGADPFSQEMRATWVREGMDVSLVLTDPARLPGLYAIRTDAEGEREFYYWRERSAARALFTLPGIDEALDQASHAGELYLSGITLSLFGHAERRRLSGIAEAVRGRGGRVIFDPNYRPAGWVDAAAARTAIEALAPYVSIALPTFTDEAVLFGDAAPEQSVLRWRAWGAEEVIVKLGARGCLVGAGDGRELVSISAPVNVVDTTGAGDAFNAAYLATRLGGRAPARAARAAHRLAAEVIQCPGAILPAARLSAIRAVLDSD
ncbi:MAG TPA: sugar kinase [Steroidobacteraceae bacterium]